MDEAAAMAERSVMGAPGEVDLYRLFAFVFGYPTLERYQWLARPELPSALRELWEELDCVGELPDLGGYESYADYESTYLAIFEVGAPSPPVPLVESAHYKSIPPQQIALENTAFYDVLGLRPDSRVTVPDHLVTQLEFLAAVRHARETTTDETNRTDLARLECDFLERHLLRWVPTALEKLQRAHPPVFPVLLALLLSFLKTRQQ